MAKKVHRIIDVIVVLATMAVEEGVRRAFDWATDRWRGGKGKK